MECKENAPISGKKTGAVLMEPKWNVKVLQAGGIKRLDTVLMEPKWNVKEESTTFPVLCVVVLMEPKWNVKQTEPERYT